MTISQEELDVRKAALKMKLHSAVRRAYREQPLTQDEIGKRIGWTGSQVKYWLNGDSKVSIETANALIAAMDLDIEIIVA